MSKPKIPKQSQLRNLAQYRNLTDEEFEEKYYELLEEKLKEAEKPSKSSSLEIRIEQKKKEFEDAYDLTDLKFNDMETFRALVRALISLEDVENEISDIQDTGTSSANIAHFQKLNQIASSLRQDISKLQDDLKITRKIRKSDKEANVIMALEDLRQKAKKFAEQKMSYIFCPDCKMLLCTAWFLYPYVDNKIALTCNRTLDNGEKCGCRIVVNTTELIELGNTNSPETMPDTL